MILRFWLLLMVVVMTLGGVESATVSWENQPIVMLRTAYADHPPTARVRRAVERIDELAKVDRPLLVTAREVEDGSLIEIDAQGVLMITDGDADRLIGETRASAVASAVQRLQVVLSRRKQVMADQGIMGSLVLALAAGAAWLMLGWLLLRGRSRLVQRLHPTTALHAPASGTMAIRLIRGDLLRTVSVWGVNLLTLVALLTLTSVCSTIGLSSLPSTHRWTVDQVESLSAMLWDLLVTIGGSLPGLLMAVVIFLAAAAANLAMGRFFRSVKAGRLQMGWIDVHTVRPTRLLSTALLWGMALVMAYPYLPGSSSDAFKGVSVLLGLMVSLGASSQLGQLASGFILIYLRSLRPGDYVRIGTCEGTVKDVGLFTLTLTTPFDEVVSLPNVVVLGSQVTNYSRSLGDGAAQLQAVTTIGYDTSWQKVHELLLAAAQATPGLIATSPPQVLQRALSDFYVEYTLCVRVADPTARVRILSLLHAAILDQFNAAGVQIMSPHYFTDPAKPKLATVSAPV